MAVCCAGSGTAARTRSASWEFVAGRMAASGTGAGDGKDSKGGLGIAPAVSRLKKAGLLSCTRRGAVRITGAGLREIGGYGMRAGPANDHPLRGARIVEVDQSTEQWVNGRLVKSPPLTQEEIDGIEASASNDDMKTMPGPEFLKMLRDIAGSGGRAGCRAP